MNDRLPGGLADALHILEPSSLRGSLIALLLLAALLWWLRRRRRAAVATATVTEVPAPEQPAIPPAPGIEERIRALRRRIRRSRSYRAGCHLLSQILRDHFEHRSGRPVTVLTAKETELVLADQRMPRLLNFLASHQFSRREPRRDDFEGICDLALETVDGSDGAGGGEG